MAFVATDWTITRSNGNIRYIGDDHGAATPIKPFETTGTLGLAGGSSTAVRTSDV